MDIAERRVADVLVVAPEGAIDFPNAQRLEGALAPHLARTNRDLVALLLDLGRVGYVSSMGLRVLMVAARTLRPRNARVAVSSLQPVVAEIFGIARFNHVVEVFPTVRDALGALSPSALAAWDGAGQ